VGNSTEESGLGVNHETSRPSDSVDCHNFLRHHLHSLLGTMVSCVFHGRDICNHERQRSSSIVCASTCDTFFGTDSSDYHSVAKARKVAPGPPPKISECHNFCSRAPARLSNTFSKKVEKHALSVALHYMNCNFCRIHKTLRVTPAMAAGVTDRLWEIGGVGKMLEDWESQQKHAA
jgi:hypothetical protein